MLTSLIVIGCALSGSNREPFVAATVSGKVVHERQGGPHEARKTPLAEAVVYLSGDRLSSVPRETPKRIFVVNGRVVPENTSAQVGRIVEVVTLDKCGDTIRFHHAKPFGATHPVDGFRASTELKELGLLTFSSGSRVSVKGTIVVIPNDRAKDITDGSGRFRISCEVKPGSYQLNVWHPRYGMTKRAVEITRENGVHQIEIDLAENHVELRQ